ncbi:MAG TPA: carboxylesterase family protein [Bradyrhizobium sp.]|nr:carboxylesterase family protein [Bradyrhizobium sp.]
MNTPRPVAITPFGRLHGLRIGALNVFRGVRFVQAPVGHLRFEPPADLPLSTEDIDAAKDGAIAPQPPARLEPAMGPIVAPQGEDCLFATVWAPTDLGDERVPVLVWFHGGAFTTGAGSLEWYSGSSLAARGRIVVVSINSRLGPLGYLRLPGVTNGNLGIADQLAGLRWVQRSIAAFGGDPSRVTIMGQSAGAFTSLAMIANPAGRSLFHQAILQSGPYGLNISAEAADGAGAGLARELGIPAQKSAFQEVPVDRLLEASGKVARSQSIASFLPQRPAFQPCVDGEIVAEPLLSATAKGAAGWCNILVGYTREEMSVFSKLNPAAAGLTREATREVFGQLFGPRGSAAFDEYIALRGWRDSSDLIADALGDLNFVEPALRLANHQEQAGRPAFVYQFNWPSPRAGFGSNHCLELPFVFGNMDAWKSAPMVSGANVREIEHITDAMQSAWLSFIATGRPDAGSALPWQPYQAKDRSTMCFDGYIAPMRDLAGFDWRAAFSR